jgi:hypothetical protein
MSYVVVWAEDRGAADDSEPCRAIYATHGEAEFALELLERDSANHAIRTSWQDPDLLSELKAIPF